MRGEGKYLAKLYGPYPSLCWTKNFQCEVGNVFFIFHQEHPLMSCLTWTIFHPCHPVISVVIQWARYLMKLWNTCALMAFFVLHFFMGWTFFLGPPWIYYRMKLRDHPVMCLFNITTFQHITECVHWNLSTFFVSILRADTGKRKFCREHERCYFSGHLRNFRGKLPIFLQDFHCIH